MSSDLSMGASFFNYDDLSLSATFFVHHDLLLNANFGYYSFEEGDRVLFDYNGANCQGLVTEQVYDGTDVNNNFTYHVRVTYCNNWAALGDDDDLVVSASILTLLYPQAW